MLKAKLVDSLSLMLRKTLFWISLHNLIYDLTIFFKAPCNLFVCQLMINGQNICKKLIQRFVKVIFLLMNDLQVRAEIR